MKDLKLLLPLWKDQTPSIQRPTRTYYWEAHPETDQRPQTLGNIRTNRPWHTGMKTETSIRVVYSNRWARDLTPTNGAETSHPEHPLPPNRSENSLSGNIPTTNSEISHPGEQTPKQIRDLIISDTTQRSLKPHTWYIHPWTETSYTATYSHKPHFGDIYTQKAQEPCILGCTPINSSERWYSGTQIPPSSKSLKWYLDIDSDSTETSHLRDSVAQTALPPNTLDADSGHVGDVWD